MTSKASCKPWIRGVKSLHAQSFVPLTARDLAFPASKVELNLTGNDSNTTRQTTHSTAIMSMFRSKKIDLGCFLNIKVIRDHTKRKVFEANEPQRCVASSPSLAYPALPSPCLIVLLIKFLMLSVPSAIAFFASLALPADVLIQTSSPLHNPQPQPPASNARRGPTPALPNACLHPWNTDQKQMY